MMSVYHCKGLRALAASCNLSLDYVHNRGFSKSTQISKLVALSGNDLAHNAAHDLSIGQIISYSVYIEVDSPFPSGSSEDQIQCRFSLVRRKDR